VFDNGLMVSGQLSRISRQAFSNASMVSTPWWRLFGEGGHF
jgi:hypothetical protein